DDGAHEIWHHRGIAADEGLADEVGELRDRGEDCDVADQQIEQRVMLLLDHLPFRLRRQQERLDPIGKLAQVLCPHALLQAALFRIVPSARSLSSGWRDEPCANSFGPRLSRRPMSNLEKLSVVS